MYICIYRNTKNNCFNLSVLCNFPPNKFQIHFKEPLNALVKSGIPLIKETNSNKLANVQIVPSSAPAAAANPAIAYQSYVKPFSQKHAGSL